MKSPVYGDGLCKINVNVGKRGVYKRELNREGEWEINSWGIDKVRSRE